MPPLEIRDMGHASGRNDESVMYTGRERERVRERERQIDREKKKET